MELLIDTNIFLDMFQNRQPFLDSAIKIISSCVKKENNGYVSSHSVSDLFYILRKDFSADKRKEFIRFISSFFTIITEDNDDFLIASSNLLPDLEDSLQMRCAQKCQLDFIITRNIKDFETSSIRPILPDDFIKIIK